MEENKKKNKLPVIAAISAGLIAVIVVAVLFTTGVFGASAAKKYAKLQKELLNRLVEETSTSYSDSYQKVRMKEDQSTNYNIALFLSEECQGLLEMDMIDDVELSGGLLYDQQGQLAQVLTDYNLNGTLLFQSDIILGLQQMMAYVCVPQLSDSYLSMDMQSYMEEMGITDELEKEADTALAFDLTPQLYEKIVNGMSKIWLDHEPNKVTLEKKQEQKLGDVCATMDLYEASYTQMELLEISIDLCSWLQQESDVRNLIVQYSGMEAEELDESIAYALEELNDERDYLLEDEEDDGEEAQALLLVRLGALPGSQKSAISLELEAFEDGIDESFLYFGGIQTEEGDKKEGFFSVGEKKEQSLLQLSFTSEPDNNSGRMGNISLEADMTQEVGEVYEFDIAFERYQKGKDGSVSFYAAIDSAAFMGMGVELQVDANTESQEVSLDLKMGNIELATLEIEFSKGEAKTVSLPQDVYDSEQENQLTAYLQNANLVGFLTELMENEDVMALLDFFDINMEDLVWELLWGVLPEETDEMVEEEIGSEIEEVFEPDEAFLEYAQDSEYGDYKGYTVDEEGWVDFEVDLDEIVDRGERSTGYDVFEGLTLDEELVDGLAALLSQAYGGRAQYDGSYMSNFIAGYEPYLETYYSTNLEWYDSQDEYYVFSSVSKDTVSDELQSIVINDRDKERALDILGKMGKYLLEMDVSELQEAFKLAQSEGSDYFTVGEAAITWFETEDYINFSLLPSYE